jgi:hypothetical protein
MESSGLVENNYRRASHANSAIARKQDYGVIIDAMDGGF